ncbi:hypothetical protein [Aquisalimonas sp.]|uniref:hypothetical protein n=1 Tax=Aquisalimonas sp. TaxID=1872621 RepID=UPI0025B9F503|nr:hypothetical protein [Aquisalimonas sp.]
MSRDRANVRKVLQYRRERWRKGGRQVGALERADLPLQLINGAAGSVVGTDTPVH